MGIHQNFVFLLITIWRFTYYYGSLIYRFIKELATNFSQNFQCQKGQQTLEKTEGAIKNEQARETGNQE
jgi:hypothetical protein